MAVEGEALLEEDTVVVVVVVVAVAVMVDARNRMEAFWSAIFHWIAGQKNFEFHLRDLELSGTCIFPRTITQGNLEDLHLCSLWMHMRPQRLNII